jgi:hypothetical protein
MNVPQKQKKAKPVAKTNLPKRLLQYQASGKNSLQQVGPTSRGLRNPRKLDKLGKAAQESHAAQHDAAIEYLKCLIRPDLYTARVPNPLPVYTCLCQSKGTFYLTPNAQGNLVVALRPTADAGAVLAFTSDATLTESSPLSGLTWSIVAGTTPPTSSVAQSRRIVGAFLEIEDLAPDMYRTGILSAAFLPYSYTVANMTYDTVRDQQGCLTSGANSKPVLRTFWRPYDTVYTEFSTPGVGIASQEPTLFALISGAVTASSVNQIRVSYRVIYEFVPKPGQTDLLIAQKGPVSSPGIISTMMNVALEAGSAITSLSGGAIAGHLVKLMSRG